MKRYITYNQIHKTVATLADKIKSTDFQTDVIVAIGSGGYIPSRMLKTFIKKPILTVGIAYYDVDNNPMDEPHKIQWIDEVEKKLKGKRILLIDEVDDTRVTLEYCIKELLRHEPEEIAVMVLHNKNKDKKGIIPGQVSHYFAGEQLGDDWIVYPWDAEDIESHDQLSGDLTEFS
ncbi:phosphoribosyltransferase [Spirochaeta cellobiosiphila]|uniref:phosphoribosyltransferase n=1 Tax=Spirochaeta cellobiosiphila TaxID=504483 RepID=UPI00041F756F|nr:phosphoribosyltransferase family protein [Spirochaeta cellobiosiphila]